MSEARMARRAAGDIVLVCRHARRLAVHKFSRYASPIPLALPVPHLPVRVSGAAAIEVHSVAPNWFQPIDASSGRAGDYDAALSQSRQLASLLLWHMGRR